tara:strand:- start:1973 stop:2302 length:330 start_codon:yes stop_codon:yes gene_type:complete
MMNTYKQNYKDIDWSVKADPVVVERESFPDCRADFATPMVIGDYDAYECPVTGSMIDGRRAHIENLKQTGCRLLEPGEKEANTKNGPKDWMAGIDRAVDKAVDEIATQI